MPKLDLLSAAVWKIYGGGGGGLRSESNRIAEVVDRRNYSRDFQFPPKNQR